MGSKQVRFVLVKYISLFFAQLKGFVNKISVIFIPTLHQSIHPDLVASNAKWRLHNCNTHMSVFRQDWTRTDLIPSLALSICLDITNFPFCPLLITKPLMQLFKSMLPIGQSGFNLEDQDEKRTICWSIKWKHDGNKILSSYFYVDICSIIPWGGVIIIYSRTLCVVFGNKLTCVLFVAIFISVDPSRLNFKQKIYLSVNSYVSYIVS